MMTLPLLAALSLASAQPPVKEPLPPPVAAAVNDIQGVLEHWSPAQRDTATKIMSRYGQPDEASFNRLSWYSRGPWKRITIGRVGTRHRFPRPHTDAVALTVSYRVPPEKVLDLWRFNGSLLPDRTRGELSIFCADEAYGVAALNIAERLMTGAVDVAQARQLFAQAVEELDAGRVPETATKLQLTTHAQPSDPDEPFAP